MNTTTQRLRMLIQLAVHPCSMYLVNPDDILICLKSMEEALNRLEYSLVKDQNPSEALQTVITLLYLLKNNMLENIPRSNRLLLLQTELLHRKLSSALTTVNEAEILPTNDLLPVKLLLRQLSLLDENLQQDQTLQPLYGMVHTEIQNLKEIKTIAFHRWLWWSSFYNRIKQASSLTINKLEEILTVLNFNTTDFILHAVKSLEHEITLQKTVSQQISYLADRLIQYKTQEPDNGYFSGKSSVQQIMQIAIKNNLILFRYSNSSNEKIVQSFEKTNTTLSVPQLALLIRLMIETKIINESNNTALLRNIAAVMSTSKSSTLSTTSLRVNYYTPSDATKSILKDYLFNMLNLLKTY